MIENKIQELKFLSYLSNVASFFIGKAGCSLESSAIWALRIFYPLLSGFLFDLPWQNQVLISIVSVGAVFIVRDFGEALLLLWLALAITGFSLLLWCIGFESKVNNSFLVMAVLIIWLVLLIADRSQISIFNYCPQLTLGFDGSAIFIYLFVYLPRGSLQNLGFIYQEDNQRSLNSIVRSLNSGNTDLRLLSSADTLGMPFFVKFILSFVSRIGFLAIDEIPLRAINVLSNGWTFLLLSYLVLGSSFSKWLFFQLTGKTNFFGRFFCLLSMIWGFQISHSAGYFPLFLLNIVVIVTVCTFRSVSVDRTSVRLFLFLIGLCLTCTMFGSWQPWIPAAGGIFLVISYKAVGRDLLKWMFHRLIVRIMIALFSAYIFFNFVVKLSRVDLESSGREHFPTEVLLVLAGLFVIAFGSLFSRVSSATNALDPHIDTQSHFFLKLISIAIFAIIFLYIFRLNTNQSQTLFFLIVFGLVFNKDSIDKIMKSSRKILNDEITDASFIFALVSFSYIVIVFLLSRFIGPIYSPMYAADKASVAFYSQFYWLPVSLLAIPITFVDRLKSFLIQKLSIFAFCSLLAIPTSITYEPVQEKWWHKHVSDSLSSDPSLPIVCSFSTEFSEDKETWVCTHFMEVLNDEKFIDLLWFQQWQSIGPRPVDLSLARRYLVEEASFKKILVLSCSVLDQEMKDFFSLVDESRVVFKTQEPCDSQNQN